METSKKSKVTTVFISVALLLIVILIGVLFITRKPETKPTNQGALTIDTSQLKSDGFVAEKKETVIPTFIATGYYDLSIGQNEKLYLVNDAENAKEDYTVVIQYTISDTETGETIFETGLIEPGNSVPFEASSYLGVGDHKVTILEQPYLMENEEWVPKFTARQKITITVLE